MVIGLTFIMLYANLFSFGYTFYEYFLFIVSRVEVDIFFIGFMLLLVSIKMKIN